MPNGMGSRQCLTASAAASTEWLTGSRRRAGTRPASAPWNCSSRRRRGAVRRRVADSHTALAEVNADVPQLNPYTATVARGVTEHAAHIDELITSHLQGWTLDRLPAVDRAVLRVAVWELLHADDVPAPVAVDEAVELAKKRCPPTSRPASSTGCSGR